MLVESGGARHVDLVVRHSAGPEEFVAWGLPFEKTLGRCHRPCFEERSRSSQCVQGAPALLRKKHEKPFSHTASFKK